MTARLRLDLGPAAGIRFRLGAALVVALLPVLVLGAVQAVVAFKKDAEARQSSLVLAAERSTASARANIDAAGALLNTLGSGALGFQCSQTLAQIKARSPGYANLIRFDAAGRVSCSAGDVPADPTRRDRTWFKALQRGDRLVVSAQPGVNYGAEPVVLAAVPASDGGALVAVVTVDSLRPDKRDHTFPKEAEVATVDGQGHYIKATRQDAFPATLSIDQLHKVDRKGSLLWTGRDATGHSRTYAASPLTGDDLFVVLSAPQQGLLSWAYLNPISGILFPLLSFGLALLAVLAVAETGVVRWITYLQRIAAIYEKGRFTVRPIQAERAPLEIKALADTLDSMAGAIVARDASLRDSLAEKDALMREIHHRVKNNLQVISSLLNMQQRVLTDPAARAVMNDTRQRIVALAQVYRALYQGPDLKRVDLRPFLEELTAQLLNSSDEHSPIRTEVHADPLVIDPDKLAPVALFAVEAISNAQKHALAGRGGFLEVLFTVRGEEAELAISDDGGGVERTGEIIPTGGLGRTLMTAFARQLRGQATFMANAKGGLTAKLTFPTPEIDHIVVPAE
ncbi:MAG: phyK [Caulobacter sp.]|nr:phyK [Caulobacter sp.]